MVYCIEPDYKRFLRPEYMARHALTVTVPFACDFDRTSRDLGRQLAQALRLAIRQGGLRSGDPLPSSRTLSKALGVSRGTVVEAFAQLVAEGFLESRQGASTWVTRTTPGLETRLKSRPLAGAIFATCHHLGGPLADDRWFPSSTAPSCNFLSREAAYRGLPAGQNMKERKECLCRCYEPRNHPKRRQ